jgi:hypothetical protein
MGLVEHLMSQENPLMGDPYKEFCLVSNNKKMDDAGLNDLLELQEQAKVQGRQMKALVASHVEDLQRSVQAEASNGT